jgi:hypothetical protein
VTFVSHAGSSLLVSKPASSLCEFCMVSSLPSFERIALPIFEFSNATLAL